jgi:ketosteroid isomerase-like protein
LTNRGVGSHLSVALGLPHDPGFSAASWRFLALALFGMGCQAPLAAAVPRSPEAPSPAPAPAPLPVAPGVPSVAPPSLSQLIPRTAEVWALSFKARDRDKLASLYTDDACIKVPGRPDACGKSAILEGANALWAMFPDARTAWSRTWFSGDVLIAESAWTGTNDLEASGRKPTHKIVGAPVVTLSWFSPDGRIREQHVYSDEGSIAMQLGSAAGVTGRAFDGLPTARERHEASGASEESSNAALVRDGFAASAASFADDAELIDFSQTTSLPSKKGAPRWIAMRTGALANSRVAMTHVFGFADAVVYEYEATGAKKRGETLTIHGVEILEIQDGKVKRAVRYRDSLEPSPLPFLPPPVSSVAP